MEHPSTARTTCTRNTTRSPAHSSLVLHIQGPWQVDRAARRAVCREPACQHCWASLAVYHRQRRWRRADSACMDSGLLLKATVRLLSGCKWLRDTSQAAVVL